MTKTPWLLQNLPELQRNYWAHGAWIELLVPAVFIAVYAGAWLLWSDTPNRIHHKDIDQHAQAFTLISLGIIGSLRIGVNIWRESKDYTWEQQRMAGHAPARFFVGKWLGSTLGLWMLHIPVLLTLSLLIHPDRLAEGISSTIMILCVCAIGHVTVIGQASHEVSFSTTRKPDSFVGGAVLYGVVAVIFLATLVMYLDAGNRADLFGQSNPTVWFGLSLRSPWPLMAIICWLTLLAYAQARDRLDYALLVRSPERLSMLVMLSGVFIVIGFAFSPLSRPLQSGYLITGCVLIGLQQISLVGRSRRGPLHLTRFWGKWQAARTESEWIALTPGWVFGLISFAAVTQLLIPALLVLRQTPANDVLQAFAIAAFINLAMLRSALSSCAVCYLPLYGDKPVIYRATPGRWKKITKFTDMALIFVLVGSVFSLGLWPSLHPTIGYYLQPLGYSTVSVCLIAWALVTPALAALNLRDLYKRELQLVEWAKSLKHDVSHLDETQGAAHSA